MTEALAKSGPNAEQIEYWNEKTGPKWVEFHGEIDRRIEPLGERAMARVGVRPGEAVLDVGCGCGQTSLALAERVGAAGSVRGVDISAVMLARARERAAAAGLDRLRFELADAQTADLGAASVDLVYSRFGVMFFADPTAAFANLRRALRPGGRLGFVCWRPLAENPWALLPFQALAELVAPPEPPPPGAPGPFALGDPARIRAILGGAGFAAIEIDAEDTSVDLAAGEGVDAAVRFALMAGPSARLLDGADDALRARAVEVLREALAPHARAGGVPLAAAAWLVRASNPA